MNDTQSSISELDKAISISAKESRTVEFGLNAEEAIDIENHKDKLIAERIKDIIHYRELRKQYANRVFIFMCIWSGVTFLVLMLKGLMGRQFELNDTVLVTLTGGTTISVIGLVGFIVQGLFNSNHHIKSK